MRTASADGGRPRYGGVLGDGPWTGTLRLVRVDVRTGWRRLVAWPLAMSGLVWVIALGVKGVYPNAADRQVYQATLGASPASAAFNGRGYNLDTLGGITVIEVGFWSLLLLPLIPAHLAVHHTRTQEDTGRADLLSATRVGRSAPMLAATLVVTAALVGTGVLISGLLVASGLPGRGSVYYALALVLYMLVFLTVGLLAGQVSQSGRGAHGMVLVVIGTLFIVRAVIDGRNWDATWATPTGWLAEVRPFGDVRLWPYLALAALLLALFLTAVRVCGRRDIGAGLVTPRPGPGTASRILRGPTGLIWRITRGTSYGWGLGAAIWGVAIGLLAQEASTLLDGNPTLAGALGGATVRPDDLMTSFAALFIALMASAVGLQGLARLSGEESSGRLGFVLSARFTRTRWWLCAHALLAVQMLAVLVAGGWGYGVSAALTAGRTGPVADGLTAALFYYPAALLIAAIGGLLLAVSSRIAALSWFLLVWAAIVALLAETLQLPSWSRDLSPLEHTGRVPIEDLDVTAVILMAGVATILAVASTSLLRRRDLAAG